MSKKGDLSLNTIASAVIVLLVVVILILIFTNKISLFSGSISDCDSKPGSTCVAENDCPGNGGSSDWYYSQQISFTCKDKNQVCCYSNCKASGGKCISGSCGTDKEPLGTSDCIDGNVCCK